MATIVPTNMMLYFFIHGDISIAACISHGGCKNGGRCGRGGRCKCKPGFKGRRCQLLSDSDAKPVEDRKSNVQKTGIYTLLSTSLTYLRSILIVI